MRHAQARIAQWMEDCKRNHPNCLGGAPMPLPTRVIAVGTEGAEPFLYETKGAMGQYTALSHCWGPPDKRPPTTVRANLSVRKRGIPIGELSPTFLEAVQLTRALGIPYLWIDSLCIIQDDERDWAREAARMADVYTNAALTISATGAADSKVGLLQPVSSRKLPPSMLLDTGPGEASEELRRIYGRRTDLQETIDDLFAPHIVERSAARDNAEPLFSRAWTLQEWVLSRRVVHFATGELLWDCLGAEGCECQGARLVPRQGRHGIWRRVFEPGSEVDKNRLEDPEWVWRKTVMIFTSRQITYDSDKLPALSGVAKSLAAERPADGGYIAGHWRSELPLSLLWRRGYMFGTKTPTSRPAKYHAPSWSWASVNGPIWYGDQHRGDICCKALDVSYELASPLNPYGALQSASLVVSGMIANVGGCVDIDHEDLTRGLRKPVDVMFISDIWEEGMARTTQDVVFLLVLSEWDSYSRELRCDGLALLAADSVGGVDRFTRVGKLSLTVGPRTGAEKKWRKSIKSKAELDEIWMAEFRASERTIIII
ncbi:heterokaryon incompatibility protein-domain-containing protein [Podospora aff. communis PSN243]|uniref:Heterokaryon incompatibility protein-domain-containing protein n=1 Tax=Podospora aff. communis PSN243 TaxID=3040156 RepID=A0AAV9GAZ6_9PEZI|nr:heterokaryon incompatibility protein-domain-containing protein [Podospora aff. communis PSN243]